MKNLFKSKTTTKVNLEEIPINNWTSENFKQWLTDQAYDKKSVIAPLVKQQFDGGSIINFKVEDLTEAGIAKGSALSIFNKIEELKKKQMQTGLLPDTSGASIVQLPTSATTSNTTTTPQRLSSPQQSQPVTPTTTATNNITTTTNPPPSYGDDDEKDDYSSDYAGKYKEIMNNPNKKTEEEEEDDKELARDLENRPTSSLPTSSGSYLPTASKSSSTSVQSFNQVPEAPMWNLDDFSFNQRQNFDFCLQKLDNLRAQYDANIINTICQNLVFPERFRYKYLNPQRLPIYENKKKNESFMKVKMVVTEMGDGAAHRFIRRFGSMFKNSTIQQMEYGMFHTALIIGPWYVEWGDSSIAVVRSKSSSKAVFAVDVTKIVGLENVAKAIDKTASICAHWNAHKTYDNKSCNCQHFATAVLEYLGLRQEFENNIKGPMRVYMDRLKNDGVCDMRYHLEPTIKDVILNSDCSEELKKFASGKSVTFKTHKMLDEFVATIQKYKPLYFDAAGKYDYMLLKSFDRAFWLRSQSSKEANNPDVHAWTAENGDVMCPFNAIIGSEVNNTIVGKDYEVEDVKIPLPVFRKK
ncbi:hypothetical protein FDP41_013099 [Naegleria fowleri]|uniref:SAM domain-containing protein n=1 Tax=Naegleria fowleri TaxID=5763 RepID=A0A6A5BYZ5_NAEFO|nr:uncharacterized protein FDP41_013099 [Naegleria fowleri]KAF0980616.1 hypothetical protein FDP41_013099 [Naegleria fowleri]